MDSQIIAAVAGPVLKWALNFVMGKVPERFRPLIAPVSSIAIWGVAGYVTDMSLKQIVIDSILTSGGAVMTHETMKDTVSGAGLKK